MAHGGGAQRAANGVRTRPVRHRRWRHDVRMVSLVNAISEFLAAVLSRLGFVGRVRRRAGIQDDLALLDRLRESPDFGDDSPAHSFLAAHITLEVAKFTGVERQRKRKVSRAGVIMTLVIGIPPGYWVYWLNQDGFSWASLFPGAIAGLMVIAVLGMFLPDAEAPNAKGGDSKSS